MNTSHSDCESEISSVESSTTQSIETGLSKYVAAYHRTRPPLEVLQKILNKQVIQFEEMQKERHLKELETRNLPDEDGFITVRSGRKAASNGQGTSVGSVKLADAEAALKAKEARMNGKKKTLFMYKFQRKDAQRSELAELRRKFAEDRKRVNEMTTEHTMIPY